MSQPKSFYELVREWRTKAIRVEEITKQAAEAKLDTVSKMLKAGAGEDWYLAAELEALLREWDEWLVPVIKASPAFTRKKLLGLPQQETRTEPIHTRERLQERINSVIDAAQETEEIYTHRCPACGEWYNNAIKCDMCGLKAEPIRTCEQCVCGERSIDCQRENFIKGYNEGRKLALEEAAQKLEHLCCFDEEEHIKNFTGADLRYFIGKIRALVEEHA